MNVAAYWMPPLSRGMASSNVVSRKRGLGEMPLELFELVGTDATMPSTAWRANHRAIKCSVVT
jgi:hypothetical protein